MRPAASLPLVPKSEARSLEMDPYCLANSTMHGNQPGFALADLCTRPLGRYRGCPEHGRLATFGDPLLLSLSPRTRTARLLSQPGGHFSIGNAGSRLLDYLRLR